MTVQSGNVTLLTVLAAGVAVSLSLCAIVRLPIVLAYVTGAAHSKRHGVLLSILFALGLIAGTVLLGMLWKRATPQGGFTMRGFQVNTLMRNGVFRYISHNLDNVERVEVVKGPASVFFGQGYPGGVINYITKRPSFTKIPTELTYQLDDNSGHKVKVDHNAVLGKKAAFRFDRLFHLRIPFLGLGVVRLAFGEGSLKACNESVVRKHGVEERKAVSRIALKPLMVELDELAKFRCHFPFIHSGRLLPSQRVFNRLVPRGAYRTKGG